MDIRKHSATFGQWGGEELPQDKLRQLWMPLAFAHGFLVPSDSADLLYKNTDYYAPQPERCIAWNDQSINVSWPLDGAGPIAFFKDVSGLFWASAKLF